MEIAERRQGDVAVLCPAGRIDNDTSAAFQDKLLATVGTAGASVVLDLAKVEYISSAGLRAVLQAARAARLRGGEFAVCALSDPVRKVFTMSGMHHVLRIYGELPC